MRFKYLGSASVAVLASLVVSGAASAQQVEPGVTDRAQDTAQTDPTAATQDQGARTVEEIVVTAQKREQSLQDVPIVVTAVSEQQLQDAGVRDIKDLTILTPGVTVTSTSSEASTTARVRGVGTVGDNPGLESSVGVVIDGVYRPRNGVGFNDLGEIERIEVLKGPQGTLFGKNTSAGVINVISKAPDFDFGLDAEATVGNYGALEYAGSVTGPLTDNIAGRLFGAYRAREGLYDVQTGGGPRARDDDNNRDYFTLRGQLLFTPRDDLDIRLIADYTHRTEFCCVGVNVVRNPLRQGYIDFLSQQRGGTPGTLNPPDPFERLAFANRDTDQNIEDGGVSAEITYDLNPDVTLTSISAYREYEFRQGQDADFSTADIWYREPGQNSVHFAYYQQELRLAGTSDRLDWLVGGFYAREELDRQDRIVYGPDFERYFGLIFAGATNPATFPAAQFALSSPAIQPALPGIPTLPPGGTFPAGAGNNDFYAQRTDSFALFTNNTFRVTDQFEITAGLRFTSEDKELDTLYTNPLGAPGCARALAVNNVLGAIAPANQAAYRAVVSGICVLPTSNPFFNTARTSQESSEEEITGTLKGAYRFTEDLLTYASYARGYKSGGFNLDRAVIATQFITPTGAVQNVPTGINPDTSFAPEFVDSYELGLKSEFFDNSLLANATLFYQKYEDFQLNTFTGVSFVVQSVPEVVSRGVDADFIYITPLEGLTLNGGLTYAETQYGKDRPRGGADLFRLPGTFGAADPGGALFRLPGSRVSFAPLYSVSLSGTYEQPFGDGLLFRTSVAAKYSSSYNTGSDLAPQKVQEGFTTVNARIGIGTEDGRYSLEAFAQNLFDEEFYQVAFDAPLQNEGTVRPAVNTFLGQPRLYGLTFRVNY